MGLFETFLTPDDLTEGRGFPQSFHVNTRILRTLLSSRFPTNPHGFIFYWHKHPIIYTEYLYYLAHDFGHSMPSRL